MEPDPAFWYSKLNGNDIFKPRRSVLTSAWRRAVITGLGVVSPIGVGRAKFKEGLLAATTGIDKIPFFDTAHFTTSYGGIVSPSPPEFQVSESPLFSDTDRYIQYAIVAAREALDDAGLKWSQSDPENSKCGIVVGTCNGGLKTLEEQHAAALKGTGQTIDYRSKLNVRYHGLGKALSHYFGISGPTITATTACASSTTALGISLEIISHGVVDTVLVGGADALCMSTMAGFDGLGAIAPGRTAPFSQPVGINLGEGAAFFLIESLERALSRGVPIQGELKSYAFTSDAHHVTSPDPRGDGAYRTMVTALERAHLMPSDLGYINTHGTGTEANDRTESRAISKLLKGQDIPISSFKSQIGHCLGAAGILEACAGLVAMENGIVPATINFSKPRPGCNLDCVPNKPRQKNYSCFLSCNYAFGGNNAAVVIGKYPGSDTGESTRRKETTPVITGFGIVSPLGIGTEANLHALQSRKRGLVPLHTRFPSISTGYLGGLVKEFNPKDVDRRLDLKGMNPISRYAAMAARSAVGEASLRVGPKEGLITGIVNGVCEGPCEENHLRAAIVSGGSKSHIGTFSQIVANATAGQVSSALMLKGYTATVSQGKDAGLLSLILADMAIRSDSSTRILAGASDEIFARSISDFDKMGLLRREEQNYGLTQDKERTRVMGEGAAYLMLEEQVSAKARSAPICARITGYGITTDWEVFADPSIEDRHLRKAIQNALDMAGLEADRIGAVIWSPYGNAADTRTLRSLKATMGDMATRIPLLTTVFNMGLCESAAGTMTLALVLGAWSRGVPLWPQLTGDDSIDKRPLLRTPVPLLVIGTGDEGFNIALTIEPEIGGQ